VTTAASRNAAFSDRGTPAVPRIEAAFDRCADALYRFLVVRAGGDVHLADDLMQQLWVQARHLDGTPDGEVEFRLRAIARNLLRTHWRRESRHAKHVPLADPRAAADVARQLVGGELPGESLERREMHDQLLLALTELPAEQQDLLVAVYFRGCSHAQLAARLGVSERAIEGRLYRARGALREKLEHLDIT